MTLWRIVTLICATLVIVNAKWLQKREIKSTVCDQVYNNSMRIQCYCTKDTKFPYTIKYAECYLTVATVALEDRTWHAFKHLKDAQKITFTNTRGIPLTYVPTAALMEVTSIKKIEIKYAVINTIFPFAFANISSVQELILRDNQIVTLEVNAFAHHRNLTTINLDTNNLLEIYRNVFVDLPVLKKLYLTNNQISTIHDKAFIHLANLTELEIDRNKVFSLNSATFEGLVNLERLDLSSNSLEVIGYKTFSALVKLKVLNLEGNKIQMLDEKAFDGLRKLLSLSLARNKLNDIQNDKVFESLKSLTSLSLRGNQMKELKAEVMSPILHNFYGNNSMLDVEDNNFPCDCRLDWFMILMNKTLNKNLKMTLENFKCIPDAALKVTWTKASEYEKVNQQMFEDEDPQYQGNDYEYYDDTQLNGKLFYLDVRHLLKCKKDLKLAGTGTALPTKVPTSPTTTTIKTITNLSLFDTTTHSNNFKTDKTKRGFRNEIRDVTTTRLATVSAKPADAKIYENMASDEAKPENKMKTHRSIQNENKPLNGVDRNLSSVVMIALFTFYRLAF